MKSLRESVLESIVSNNKIKFGSTEELAEKFSELYWKNSDNREYADNFCVGAIFRKMKDDHFEGACVNIPECDINQQMCDDYIVNIKDKENVFVVFIEYEQNGENIDVCKIFYSHNGKHVEKSLIKEIGLLSEIEKISSVWVGESDDAY